MAYREILGQGRHEGEVKGRQEGRRDEGASVTLPPLNRRCIPLTGDTTALIQALPVDQLEALPDFTGSADLTAWLTAHTSNHA